MKTSFFSLLIFFLLQSPLSLAQSLSIRAPNIGVNTLFLGQHSNFHKGNPDPAASEQDQQPNGIDLQEAEVQFYAEVDPYSKLNVILSVHPDYTSDGTVISKGWNIEPEEAYVETLHIPQITLKAGKTLASFGKHNQLHTHAFPFVGAPLVNLRVLGEEGLNDSGLSAAWLMPFERYSELTVQFLKGEGENSEFNSPTPADGVWLGHYKFLDDLNDATTLEAGVSAATGKNSEASSTEIFGADLTLKYRPEVGGKYHSLIAGLEYIERNRKSLAQDEENITGLTIWTQVQWAERWSTLYRYDFVKVKESLSPNSLANGFEGRNSIALQFKASEFSLFKFEFDIKHGGVPVEGSSTEQAFYVQGQFLIGSHPAHTY